MPLPPAGALTWATEVKELEGGISLVHWVAEDTGEADIGLPQWQAQGQGPGVGGSWCPSLLQLTGGALDLPGYIQDLYSLSGPTIQSDIAPAGRDGC